MIIFDNAGKAHKERNGVIRWQFRGFNAVFPDGQNLCVLAPRGQGKTTFISIACGNDHPSEGNVIRRGRVSFPFAFRSSLTGKLTGKQNLRFLCDIYGRNFAEAYDFCAGFSEIGRYIDIPMRSYNNDIRGRFCGSLAFALGFTHILIDDGMDSGDNKFRKKCHHYVRDNADRLTLTIATSDPDTALRYCSAGYVLNEGRINYYADIKDAVEAFHAVNQVFV
jgi:capsular polysaccharide transport system ATP-binding protein